MTKHKLNRSAANAAGAYMDPDPHGNWVSAEFASDAQDAIENLLGFMDTPIGRMRFKGEMFEEAVKHARETLEKMKQ